MKKVAYNVSSLTFLQQYTIPEKVSPKESPPPPFPIYKNIIFTNIKEIHTYKIRGNEMGKIAKVFFLNIKCESENSTAPKRTNAHFHSLRRKVVEWIFRFWSPYMSTWMSDIL